MLLWDPTPLPCFSFFVNENIIFLTLPPRSDTQNWIKEAFFGGHPVDFTQMNCTQSFKFYNRSIQYSWQESPFVLCWVVGVVTQLHYYINLLSVRTATWVYQSQMQPFNIQPSIGHQFKGFQDKMRSCIWQYCWDLQHLWS